MAASILSAMAFGAISAGTAGAVTPGSLAKTFSFIGRPGSKTAVVVNVDGLLINARCNTQGEPVIFAFSSATADLFARIYDGLGRLHLIKNTSFTKSNKGVFLSTTSGDFDATGVVLFETSTGKVVTVSYAFDNATTLAKQNFCTVFGSYVAS